MLNIVRLVRAFQQSRRRVRIMVVVALAIGLLLGVLMGRLIGGTQSVGAAAHSPPWTPSGDNTWVAAAQTPPDAEYVSFRASAEDDQGSAVEQTILRAFRLG